MGFQNCVPRLCALKRNAYFPYPVKKTCSFVYNCPLKRYTVFPNYLLDVQRTRDMGTVFFTPLWQIECTSMATTAIKENDNFLYPQKKVMSLSRCAGPPSQCGNIFKQRHRSYLQPPPSTIEHSLHKCLGKAFPNHRGVCHSAWKWNASQLQTTPELISKSICYDEYYFCTKTAILYTPFRFRIQFFVFKGNKSIPKSSTWLPMNFLRSLFFLKAGVAE